MWVSNLRAKKDKLEECRRRQLDELGFVWDAMKRSLGTRLRSSESSTKNGRVIVAFRMIIAKMVMRLALGSAFSVVNGKHSLRNVVAVLTRSSLFGTRSQDFGRGVWII